MQKELKDRGLYDTLERAFVNWALNFSLWQLNTMTGSAYEKTYRLLKRKGFDCLISAVITEDIFTVTKNMINS